MTHANAALTPQHRLRLARLIVEGGWPPARAAEFFNVSWRTADKWARRYREEGMAGMRDRSSARHTQHAKTSEHLKRKIVHLRWKQRLGPVPIAAKLGMPASTVHAVLVRCRLNRLTHIDRVTGEPARRYERERPGELIHVGLTKFGNIPDGGGWRFVGKSQGDRNRQSTRDRTGVKARKYQPQDRHLLRAHRHRRLLPGGLRRDPRRREGHHRSPASSTGPWPGSPNGASASSGFCPTTAAPTSRSCGATAAPNWESR